MDDPISINDVSGNKSKQEETPILIDNQTSEQEHTTFFKHSFDTLLNKIGFGPFHWKAWLIFGVLGWADGAESQVLSFIIPIFKKQFAPDYDIESTLGVFVYIGFLIGSLQAGYYTDKFGRRKPVVYTTLLMIIFCLASAWPSSLEQFIIFRTLFGVVDGIFSPLAYTYLAEVTPAKNRGRFMTMLGINYTIGELIACVIAIMTLDNFKSGDWHALLAFSTVPAFIAWIAALFFLDESPRFALVTGKFDLGISVLKKMYRENKKTEAPLLSEEEEKQLVNDYKEHHRRLHEEGEFETSTIKRLFMGKMARITVPVWINWFSNSLTFFGLTYILPTVLSELNQADSGDNNNEQYSVSSVIFSCLSELPTFVVAFIIVDMKKFGRKNSMGWAFALGALFSFLASFQLWPGIITWISMSKFCFSLAYTLNYMLTSELYPTRIRGTGLGMAASFGRFGSIVMPVACSALNKIHPLAPFIMFGAISGLSAILTFTLPYDTTNLEMENLDKSAMSQLGEKKD